MGLCLRIYSMYFVPPSQITADSHDLTSILTFAMLVLIDTGIVYWVSVHQCTCIVGLLATSLHLMAGGMSVLCV